MITLAEPKILKSNNMITLGFNILLNTPKSLTPQRFSRVLPSRPQVVIPVCIGNYFEIWDKKFSIE